MGMVLSIYTKQGFREVKLPERVQHDIVIRLDRDVFGLSRDVTMTCTKREDRWALTSGDLLLFGASREAEDVSLQDGKKVEFITREENRAKSRDGEPDNITVICYMQQYPFYTYGKYSLANISRIDIGRKDSNIIQYKNDFVSGVHAVITFQENKAILRDESRNGTYINARRVAQNQVLHYGDCIRIMRLNIVYLGNMLAISEGDGVRVSLQRLSGSDVEQMAAESHAASHGKVLYHRSPRNLKKMNTEPFEIEGPPALPNMKDPPLLMTIGPSLTMAVPMLLGTLMTAAASGNGSNPFMYMGLVTALSSAVIGTIWAIANIRMNKKNRKSEEKLRVQKYGEYLIETRKEIEEAYQENTEALKERYTSATQCCALDENSTLLWNRNDSYEDFLAIRVGIGDIPFQAPIVIPKDRFTMIEDTMAEKPSVIQENFSTLTQVPVTVDIREHRLVGINGGGSLKNAIGVAQTMIAQIATSNAYTDVKIAVVYDAEDDLERNAWDFALWLPHVWSGDKKIRFIGTNRAERSEVFQNLTQILRNRMEEDRRQKTLLPRYILFVSNPALLDGEAISRYVFERETDVGLSTVLIAPREQDLPNECEWIVENGTDYQGVYFTRHGAAEGVRVQFDTIAEESLMKLSRSLCRIEVVEANQEGEIPNTLTFFDMLGVERPEQLNAAARWQKADTVNSMRALVGFKNGNAPCYLDIHERYHGPHGLIAGTTGSGKSETLQTYILSLAVNFSPEDVSFFLIDYKGGGMANLFANLPHMIGSISNLSGNQVKRAMVSIQSENRRRQRIFTEYGVNNINGYTALYKSGDATEPVPHLFIIIDEFAELKREEPDFMKELISVAQVGRSLGVHLILSTQRPSGTVDENIWANSKFRLCLRVQDRQDSMDMLHRPEAAYLTQTGRGYLQVGNDEVFELFQSGWSGALYDEAMSGSSLQIAQMLSATGKVDLAGNHAKIKRKEELKRAWIAQLIGVLRETERQTGASVGNPNFSFAGAPNFADAFYRNLQKVQPDFEHNQFNSVRIADFCEVYRALNRPDAKPAALADAIVRQAAREGKRLPEAKSRTQLEVTVDYLKRVAKQQGMATMRQLWLPELPTYLYLDEIEEFTSTAFQNGAWRERPRRFQLSTVIGMVDDPENQAQMPVSIDFARGGHHMLIGGVSTGKSTFLQSLVYGLASNYSPDLLNLYCLDFSAKMLRVFRDLKHVGAYLDEGALETDQADKFFAMIGRTLEQRKRLLAGTSFEDYVNHEGWTIPAVVIVIDNYGGFREKTGEKYDEAVKHIAKEGIGCGVYLMVSASGTGSSELPGRLAEYFRTGIALEMKDAFAYGDVLHIVKPQVLPEAKVKGRGLIYFGERILEFQTALAAHAESGTDRNEILQQEVRRMNDAWQKPAAQQVPAAPAVLHREEFVQLPAYQEALRDPAAMPVGLDAETGDLYSFNLRKHFIHLVSGTAKSGKTTMMVNLIRNAVDKGDEVLIVETGGEAFAQIAAEKGLTRATDSKGVADIFLRLSDAMARRAVIKKNCYDQHKSQDETFDAALANRRIDLFLGNLADFLKTVQDPSFPDRGAPGFLDRICERGQGYNLFLYAELEDADKNALFQSYTFTRMKENHGGIRFGGRFHESFLPCANVNYKDEEKPMQPGIGVISSKDWKDRLVKVMIPRV